MLLISFTSTKNNLLLIDIPLNLFFVEVVAQNSIINGTPQPLEILTSHYGSHAQIAILGAIAVLSQDAEPGHSRNDGAMKMIDPLENHTM